MPTANAEDPRRPHGRREEARIVFFHGKKTDGEGVGERPGASAASKWARRDVSLRAFEDRRSIEKETKAERRARAGSGRASTSCWPRPAAYATTCSTRRRVFFFFLAHADGKNVEDPSLATRRIIV